MDTTGPMIREVSLFQRCERGSSCSAIDSDQLTALVCEVIPESSCLVFCPSKKNCQNVALLLVDCLPRFV